MITWRTSIIGLLLLSIVVGGVPATSIGTEQMTMTGANVDTDDILLKIDLQSNGDAVWTIEYRTHLDDTETTEAFEQQRAAIEEDPESYVKLFHERMTATAQRAADATGHEMTITNMTVTAETRHLPKEYGVIAYHFEWHKFATVTNNELRAGAAIDGLFVDDGTRLIVTWPEGYTLTNVGPTPNETRENAVLWHGPTEFLTGEPRVIVSAAGTAEKPVSAVLVGGLLVTISGSALAWWFWTGKPCLIGSNGAADSRSRQTDLLSNEEHVLTVLRDHDGRAKQQEIVRALGWTEAKTSQVLGNLREDGVVEVFRLGRENVVSLPDSNNT